MVPHPLTLHRNRDTSSCSHARTPAELPREGGVLRGFPRAREETPSRSWAMQRNRVRPFGGRGVRVLPGHRTELGETRACLSCPGADPPTPPTCTAGATSQEFRGGARVPHPGTTVAPRRHPARLRAGV